MNNKLVSVIMSEYNTEIELLEESIKSIIEQTYKNIELIIIDDCGKNNVSEIVKKYNDSRIRVYKNKSNSGLVFSLNKALKLSNGYYVARMDTDDYSYKDRIEKEVAFIEKNNYDVIGANAYLFNGKKIWGKTNYSGIIKKEIILKGCPMIHPTVLGKKEAFEKIGGYKNFKRCEDYALWIEMFCNNYKLYNMNDVLIKYHLSIDDYKKRNIKTRKEFFKMLKIQYKKLNPRKIDYYKIIIKNFIAGILPYRLIYNLHKIKFKMKGIKKNEKNDFRRMQRRND